MKFQIALAAALLVAVPAFAQGADRTPGGADHGSGGAQSDARRTGDTNEQGERLICRLSPTSSTSRMSSRRVCRTAEQWREMQREQ